MDRVQQAVKRHNASSSTAPNPWQPVRFDLIPNDDEYGTTTSRIKFKSKVIEKVMQTLPIPIRNASSKARETQRVAQTTHGALRMVCTSTKGLCSNDQILLALFGIVEPR